MARQMRTLTGLGAVGAVLLLAACSGSPDDAELANLDNQIAADQSDPALTSALQDQILVDPSLSQQSNRNAIRPAAGPVQAQYPPGTGSASPLGEGAAGCAAAFDNFQYANDWASRLPPPFLVYPGGRVTEAAANNSGACRMRVVTFVAAETPDRLLNWYQARAEGAGYSAERVARGGDQILAGTGASGDLAYYLIVTPRGRGSDVALIINTGA